MTNPCLTLDGVSFVLPDGRALFSDISEQFNSVPTGLVGRNGVGKSLLARILAGELQASSGLCLRSGRVHYLAQQVVGDCVAELAGVQPLLGALQRIEAGSTDVEDFDALGEQWDVRQRLEQALHRAGLGHLQPDTPSTELSGGQAMRVVLLGAWLSGADFLILDEPTNHLDAASRQALIEQLQHWPHGLLVISHDRQLLNSMSRVVELSSLGLGSYGGNYNHYERCKAVERQSALEQLEQSRLELKRAQQHQREQHDRQQHRQARGQQQSRDSNQAKILIGRQKERSEQSAGKLQLRQQASANRLAIQVREAAEHLASEALITLHVPPVAATHRCVAHLDDIELQYAPPPTRRLSLMLRSGQRLGITGPNGCGKSSLLNVLAGREVPRSGHCKVHVASAWLDQSVSLLAPQLTVLEQLMALNRTAEQGVLRMRLAQLGLDEQRIVIPSAHLSGGERIKAAMALVLYARQPAPLLLLDEPGNHLDLPSVQALERMLLAYPGTLVVVSHDPAFMAAIGLTEHLQASAQGWQMTTL